MTALDLDGLRAPEFVLVKRGLYYAPGNHGYTGILERAGRYHESDADPKSGVVAIHESQAPMFSKACWEDVKVRHLLGKIATLEREVMQAREEAARIADEFAEPNGHPRTKFDLGYENAARKIASRIRALPNNSSEGAS